MDTHGHILGCGSRVFPDRERSNEFRVDEQDKILSEALIETVKNVGPLTEKNTKEFVLVLAPTLQRILHDRGSHRTGIRR